MMQPVISAISTFDSLVVLAYLVAAVVVGLSVGRGNHTLDDYLLGGRNIPWWALLASIVAAETSSATFLSVPGLSFAKSGDFRFLQLAIGYIVGRTLVVVLFLPAYFRGSLFTAYELLEQRFGLSTRRIASALFLVARNIGDALRLFLTAIVLSKAMGMSLTSCIIVTGVVTAVYTLFGGMRSVVWNDCLQFVVYLVAAIASAVILLQGIPGGFEQLWAYAESHEKLRMFDFSWKLDDPYTFWAGLIGGTFLTLGTHGTDQMIVQRCLSARSQREAGRTLILSGVVVMVQFALFLAIGVALSCYFDLHPPAEPIKKPDEAFASFIVHNLPLGLLGLTLAGVVAASLSSSLNSSAATVVEDFGSLLRIDALAPKQRLTISKLVTLIFGVVQIVIAIIAAEMGLTDSVVNDVLAIAGFTFGILLGVFCLGLLPIRISSAAASTGMLVGICVLIAVKFGPRFDWPLLNTAVAWPWYPVIGSITTFTVGLLLTPVFPPREATVENLSLKRT